MQVHIADSLLKYQQERRIMICIRSLKRQRQTQKKKWQHLPPASSRAHLREQHKKSEISSNGQPFQKCNTFENISRDGARGAATHACGDRKFECCRGLSALILKNSTKIRLHWGQRYKNTDAENQFSNIESRGTSNH